MLDSIQVALSGMVAYQRGLNVISNNVSNMNTVGFRGSDVGFSDLYWQGSGDAARDGGQGSLTGAGVDASRTFLDMKAADAQATGQPLDAALDGNGWFVVKDESGQQRYTRDGNFDLDPQGDLVIKGTKIQVLGLLARGQVAPISLSGLKQSGGKATTTIKFDQDLSSNDSTFTINGVTVVDKLGGSHTVKLVFTLNTSTSNGTNATNWDIAAFEGDAQIGTSSLQFVSGFPGSAPDMTLSLSNSQTLDVALDFSGVSGATRAGSDTSQPNSTLAVESQDGVATGTLTSETFDEKGVMQLTYSNGQTVAGPTLALAEIPDESRMVELSSSLFDYRGTAPVTLRSAGADVKVEAGQLEPSNVDLTTEFSSLILMQRGYQAASEVVSTANTMIQQLIDMRSGK